MNRKEIFVLILLLLVTLGLTAGAVYQQTHYQNVTNAAVLKAQKERNSAQSEAATAKFNLQAAQSQVQTVTAQKVAACAALTVHKLSDPACVTPKE